MGTWPMTIMSIDFKIGDVVRCVDQAGTKQLRFGYQYTVLLVVPLGELVSVAGTTGSFRASRFELVYRQGRPMRTVWANMYSIPGGAIHIAGQYNNEATARANAHDDVGSNPYIGTFPITFEDTQPMETKPESTNKYKPFDLEAAKKGAPIVDRCGHPVEFVTHLADAKPVPKIVVMTSGRVPAFMKEDGRYYTASDKDSPFDLFMAPVETTMYVNVYRTKGGHLTTGGALWRTENVAAEECCPPVYSKYIGTFPVTIKE